MAQPQAQVKTNHNITNARQVFEQMINALNRHDLETMVGYFAPDFHSEQPFHPERAFTGPAGVHKNWSFFFATVPDTEADILNLVVQEDTVWAEIHFHGTQHNGTPHSTRGVILNGITDSQISWARLYIE